MEIARLPRILGAVIYDLVIVCALIFVAAQWFPLVSGHFQGSILFTAIKQLYILAVGFLYYAISWRRGGQTIGMKAWKIQLRNTRAETATVSWRRCALRFLIALLPWIAIGSAVILLFNRLEIPPGWNLASTWLLFGLVYLMSSFSTSRGSPQDRVSGTRLFRLPRSEKSRLKAGDD